MNIQAEDGKWYHWPEWFGDNCRIYVTMDEELVLNYRGRVLWATARRALRLLGIKAKLDMVKPDAHLVLGGRFVPSSVFSLKLIRPIPVPHSHEGFFDEAPNPLHNGRTLSWTHSGQRWKPIGPK